MVGVQEKIESMNELTPEVTQKIWTDEEFMALPDDGNRYELVNGELIVMGAAGAKHGYYVALMSFFLTAYVRLKKLGLFLTRIHLSKWYLAIAVLQIVLFSQGIGLNL